jgi:hypothetical protein
MTYSLKAARFVALVSAVLLGVTACQSDVTAPATRAPAAASRLVAPGQTVVTISDTVDAAGTRTVIDEYAAGIIRADDGQITASIGSVTIKTVFPAVFTSSKSCITSSVVGTDVVPGWTAEVKKSGGCNKSIEVEFENVDTDQSADFKFLTEPGKTRIDLGLVQ